MTTTGLIHASTVTTTYSGKTGCGCGCGGTFAVFPHDRAANRRVNRVNKAIREADPYLTVTNCHTTVMFELENEAGTRVTRVWVDYEAYGRTEVDGE